VVVEKVPGAQRLQVVGPVEPDFLEYLPIAHKVHDVRPVVLLAVPESQARQAAWPTAFDAKPAGQGSQDDWPLRDWYLPTGHCVHMDMPAVLYEPTGQSSQVAEPLLAANVPAAQLAQVLDCMTLAKLPLGH